MNEEENSLAQGLDALREKLPTLITSSKDVTEHKVMYSLDVAKRITDEYAQGKTIWQISQQPEMPCYTTLIRWSKEHPELSKMLRSVRESRALHFEGEAIQAAQDACGKDGDRLRFEAYKWAAEVNDPNTYGKKVAHSGEVKTGITVQVVTGFDPPNKWQTPPKLNSDGTIDKSYDAISVESEVVDVAKETGPGSASDSQENAGRDSDPASGQLGPEPQRTEGASEHGPINAPSVCDVGDQQGNPTL